VASYKYTISILFGNYRHIRAVVLSETAFFEAILRCWQLQMMGDGGFSTYNWPLAIDYWPSKI